RNDRTAEEILKYSCHSQSSYGEWILHLDIKKENNSLTVWRPFEDGRPSHCGTECKIIMQACSFILKLINPIQLTSYLNIFRKLLTFEILCHQLSDCCKHGRSKNNAGVKKFIDTPFLQMDQMEFQIYKLGKNLEYLGKISTSALQKFTTAHGGKSGNLSLFFRQIKTILIKHSPLNRSFTENFNGVLNHVKNASKGLISEVLNYRSYAYYSLYLKKQKLYKFYNLAKRNVYYEKFKNSQASKNMKEFYLLTAKKAEL
ncbi:hypothetical protein MXB_4798, partial [Myxobolus squamalis]